jgi:hypothetical protein
MSKQRLVSTYTVAQFKSHSKGCNESTQKNELNRAFNQDEGMTEEALCNGSGGGGLSNARGKRAIRTGNQHLHRSLQGKPQTRKVVVGLAQIALLIGLLNKLFLNFQVDFFTVIVLI